MEDTSPRTLVDIELPPVLESVAYARDRVRCCLPAPVRARGADVVAELVRNAVKHGLGPVALKVEMSTDCIYIEVRDDRDLHLTEQLAVPAADESAAVGHRTGAA